MNNLERIPVRIEDICGVVAGVVLHPRARRNVNLRASGNCRLVELIDLGMVLSHESPMNRPRIRLTLFEPEECSLSISKSPQIGMAVLPFLGHEEFDVEGRQRQFVERQRVLNIAHGQDNVVDHIVPLKLPASR